MTATETQANGGRSEKLGLVQAVLGPERRRLLEELAAKHDRSLSAECRRALDVYLEIHQGVRMNDD